MALADLHPKHSNAQCFLSLLLNNPEIAYRQLKFKIEPAYFLDAIDRDIWEEWKRAQDQSEIEVTPDYLWRAVNARRGPSRSSDTDVVLTRMIHLLSGPISKNINFYARNLILDYLNAELLAAMRSASQSTGYEDKVRILKAKIEKLETVQLDGDKTYHLLGEMLEGHIDTKQALLERTSDSHISSGYPQLDRVVRFGRGHLIVIGGRSGMGKTMMAVNMVRHMLQAGRKVGIFSLEMAKDEIIDMLTAQSSGVPYDRLRDPHQLSGDDLDGMMGGMKVLHDQGTQLVISDKPGVDMAYIRDTMLDFKATMGGLDAVMIDHIHLIRERGDLREALIKITGTLKELAKEMAIPILALSQLNRDCDKRMSHLPVISDLKESSSIEADADAILFAYRESFYVEGADPRKAQLWVRKNRHGSKNNMAVDFLGNEETKLIS